MKRRKNNNTFKMPGVYQEHVASSVAVSSTEDAETASETLAYLNEIAKIINAKNSANNKNIDKAQATVVNTNETKPHTTVVKQPVAVSTVPSSSSAVKKKINVVDYKVYKDVNLINQENLKKIKRETTTPYFTGFKLDPDELSNVCTCQQCASQTSAIEGQYIIVDGQQVVINPEGLYQKYLVSGSCLGNRQDTVTYLILKPYIHNYQHISEIELLELLELEMITK